MPTFGGRELASLLSKSRQQGRQVRSRTWAPPTIEERFRLGFPAFRYGGGQHSRNINPDMMFRQFLAEKPVKLRTNPTKSGTIDAI